MASYGSVSRTAPIFLAGKTTKVELTKLNLVRAYELRIKGGFRVTGGTGAGTLFPDALHRLIRTMQVTVAGKPMQVWTGQLLRIVRKFFGEEQYEQVAPGHLNAGVQPFELTVEVPFYLPRSFSEDSFGFPTWATANPVLEVGWGTADDMAYGNDGVLSLEGVDVELDEIPIIGAAKDARLYAALRTIQEEYQVTQSGKGREVFYNNIGQGWEILRTIVEAFDNGTNGQDFRYSNTLCTGLAFTMDGAPEIESLDFGAGRNRNKVGYALPARENGVLVIDPMMDRDGAPGRAYTIKTDARPYLKLDLVKQAGENLVRITSLVTDRMVAVA